MRQSRDVAWADNLLNDVLESWAVHSVTRNGIFNPYLDREWNHTEDGPRTLVSQCRLIYNFARAFEIREEERFSALARAGIAALHEYFAAADTGSYIWSCGADGAPIDDTYDAYGHAFVVLALSTAALTLKDSDYRDRALKTWAFMQERLSDDHGGLIWHVSRDGRDIDGTRSQNPMMHAFEALLSLSIVDDTDAAKRGALGIWDFIAARQLRPGCLPEWYDAEWNPIDQGNRAIVDIGHAFEWAFLLSDAQALFGDDELLHAGLEFLNFGMEHGYDRDQGGIFSPIDYGGGLGFARKGWWEQCEAIRAMQRYVTRHGEDGLAQPLQQSIEFVQAHYVDDEFGGWYERPAGVSSTPSLDKGNATKLDYHVLNMCRELSWHR